MSLILNNKENCSDYIDSQIKLFGSCHEKGHKNIQWEELSQSLHLALQILKQFPELNDEKKLQLNDIYNNINKIHGIDKSKEFQLFEMVIRTPMINIEAAEGSSSFYTSSFILDSEHIRSLLNYKDKLPWNSIHLGDFSHEVLMKAIESFRQSNDNSRIELQDSWVMLHLASQLRSESLKKETLRGLDLNIQAVSLQQIIDMLNDTIFMEHVEVKRLLENHISQLITESFDKPENFSSLIHTLKTLLRTPIALNLGWSTITQGHLMEIAQLPIESLCLMDCGKLDASCMKVIAAMPKIKGLELGYNDWINDDCLHDLSSLKQLAALSVEGCPNLTDGIKKDLAGMDLLRTLNISNTALTDATLECLPKKIINLALENCRGITDKSQTSWAKRTLLQSLDLSGTSVTEATVQYLPLGLTSLSLALCKGVTEASKDIWGQMKSLNHLNLSFTEISDEIVLNLVASLKTLNLNGCQKITDNCRVSLSKMRFLNKLTISNTHITDVTVKDMPKQIEYLDMTNCKGVGKDSLSTLSAMKLSTVFVTNTALRKEDITKLKEQLNTRHRCSIIG